MTFPSIENPETRARRLIGLGAALGLLIGALPGVVLGQDDSAVSSDPAVESRSEVSGLLAEPRMMEQGINFASRLFTSGHGGELKNGFYPETSNMITGAGWLSAGPGYRRWLFDDAALVDASAAVSWRMYKMAQARFELTRLARSRLALGSQIRWQDLTQVTYFGEGPDSLDANRSEYRLTSTNIVGYAAFRPRSWLSIDTGIGWIARPELRSPTGTFKRGNPDTREMFPQDSVYGLAEQPNYLHGDASVVADTRNERGYPSSGGMYRAAWIRYSDRDARLFSFDRYEVEAAHFVPLASRRVVLAVHGWLVTSDTADGQRVPFYLLPSLGGANTLRSYANYRFHDRNMVALSAESRVALFTHLDAVFFVDAGNVARRVADLDLQQRSYGFGLRVHTRRSTIVRLDVAHGREGWQVLFRTNDPFRFSRLARRTAPVPFVP